MGAGRCGVNTNVDVLVTLNAKTRTINTHPNDPNKITIKPKQTTWDFYCREQRILDADSWILVD